MADVVERLQERLVKAQARLDALNAQVTTIEVRDANRHWTATDSAVGSGIRRKQNAKADAARFNRYDRESKLYAERDSVAREVELLAGRVADAISERDRVRFTRDDLAGAVVVRSAVYGWRKVRRVNQKTVSVDSGYSWADLIPIGDVLAFRVEAGWNE